MKTFTVGSRKNGLWTAMIDEKSLIENAKKGITDTVKKILVETQQKVGQGYPGTYYERNGLLSSLLEQSGLADELNPGELKDAWYKNIANMKMKSYKEKTEFNILDIGLLNRQSVWYGITGKPKTTRQTVTLEHYVTGAELHDITVRGEIGNVVADDNALRPLPSNNDSGFVFMRNPYPGYGYWKLYHDGYMGYNISYAPRPFIKYAYEFMFGSTASFLTSNINKVQYSEDFKVRTKTLLLDNINKYWKGK